MFWFVSLLKFYPQIFVTTSNPSISGNAGDAEILLINKHSGYSIKINENFCNGFKYFDDLQKIQNENTISYKLKKEEFAQIEEIYYFMTKESNKMIVEKIIYILQLFSEYRLKHNYKHLFYKKIIKNFVLKGNFSRNAHEIALKVKNLGREIQKIDIMFWYVLYDEVLKLLGGSLDIKNNTLEFSCCQSNFNLDDVDISKITKIIFSIWIFESEKFLNDRKTFINLLHCCNLGLFNTKQSDNQIKEMEIYGIITYKKLAILRKIFKNNESSVEKVYLNQMFTDFDSGFFNFECSLHKFVRKLQNIKHLDVNLSGRHKSNELVYILSKKAVIDKLKGLKILNNTEITPKLALCISELPVIEKLGLICCKIRKSEFQKILESFNLRKNIKEMYLEGLEIGNSEILRLKEFKQLKKLIISNCDVVNANFSEIANLVEIINI